MAKKNEKSLPKELRAIIDYDDQGQWNLDNALVKINDLKWGKRTSSSANAIHRMADILYTRGLEIESSKNLPVSLVRAIKYARTMAYSLSERIMQGMMISALIGAGKVSASNQWLDSEISGKKIAKDVKAWVTAYDMFSYYVGLLGSYYGDRALNKQKDLKILSGWD